MFWSTAPLRRGRIGPAGLPIIYRVTAHPTSCRRGCWPKKIRCDVTWKCENSLYLCRWPRRGRTRQPRAAALGMWSPLKMLQGPTGRNRSGNGPLGLATQKSNRFPRAAALGYRVWLLRSCSASGLSSLAPSEPFGFYALHGLVCPMSLGVENSDNFNRPQYRRVRACTTAVNI